MLIRVTVFVDPKIWDGLLLAAAQRKMGRQELIRGVFEQVVNRASEPKPHAAPVEEPPSAPPSAPPEVNPNWKICPVCSTASSEWALKCRKCAHPFEAVDESTEAG